MAEEARVSTSTLVAYRRGELSADDEARLQDRLVEDEGLRQDLLDLGAFEEVEKDEVSAPGVGSEAIWRQIGRRMSRRALVRKSRVLAAAALVLLAVSTWWLVGRVADEPAARVNVAVVEVWPEATRGPRGSVEIRLNASDTAALIVLNLPVDVEAERFGIRLRDAAGSILFASDAVLADDAGVGTVLLGRTILSRAQRIEVEAIDGGRRRLITDRGVFVSRGED